MVEARILEGIHFRSSDVRGRNQGQSVANRAFSNQASIVHILQTDFIDRNHNDVVDTK
jgi:hypothetical protein